MLPAGWRTSMCSHTFATAECCCSSILRSSASRRPSHFSLLVQREVTKRKDAPVLRFLHFLCRKSARVLRRSDDGPCPASQSCSAGQARPSPSMAPALVWPKQCFGFSSSPLCRRQTGAHRVRPPSGFLAGSAPARQARPWTILPKSFAGAKQCFAFIRLTLRPPAAPQGPPCSFDPASCLEVFVSCRSGVARHSCEAAEPTRGRP